jgi:hypothetical protein
LAAAPAGNVLVLQAGGSADAASLGYASAALARALRSEGVGGGLLPVTIEQGIAHAAQLCSANAGSSVLYAPTLAVGRAASGGQNIQFDVVAYDCKATLVGSRHVTAAVPARGGVNSAIDRAAGKVAGSFVKGTH